MIVYLQFVFAVALLCVFASIGCLMIYVRTNKRKHWAEYLAFVFMTLAMFLLGLLMPMSHLVHK
jgi:uncharacterized membrane protein